MSGTSSSGTTWSGTYSNSQVLEQASENPFTLTGTITVASGFALYGVRGASNWTITNAGLLESSAPSSAVGVLLPGGILTNTSSGTIIAGGSSGNGVQLAATVVNAGQISASSDGIISASYVDNLKGGQIYGGVGGVNLSGDLVNAGLIDGGGTYGVGVLLQAAGLVNNETGGTIEASGLGIHMSADGGAVVNDGLINAGTLGITRATAVYNESHGTIIGGTDGLALASATVTNSGSIIATGSAGSAESAGIVLDGGDITNDAGGTIFGAARGINVSGGDGTIVNAGYIGGGMDAVSFSGTYTNRLVVDPGARFAGTVDGGTTASSTLELAGGGPGTIAGLGSTYIDFVDITVDPGANWTVTGDNTIANGVTLTGLLTLAAGATLEIAGTLASGATIALGGPGATLIVDDSATMAGTVSGLVSGDEIDLRNVAPASVSYAAGALDYTPAGGGNASFPLSVGGASGIRTASDNDEGTDVTALCFCAGTMLATPQGDVAVEQLAVGDTVLTHDGTAQRIVWIGIGRVLAARGRRSAATPVIVRKGALADNVPHHDLRVTKGHALWFDGVLIPVEFLVNHRSILWDDRAQEATLYHIELAHHDVLLANGAPAESYRDDGNRWLFHNANTGWDQPAKPPCAPVLTGGPVVDAVWRRLLDRAGPRPGVPLTGDPDLHLLVRGTRLDPSWRRGSSYGFRLQEAGCDIRIASRSAAPQELGIARDPRLLGVAVRRIVLRRGARLQTIEADDARLHHGFHAHEPDNGWRWTDGDALLAADLFAGFDRGCELELQIGGSTPYLESSIAA